MSRGGLARGILVAVLAALLGLAVLASCSPDPTFRPGPTLAAFADFLDESALPVVPPDSLVVVTYNIQYGEDLDDALADLRHIAPGGADLYLLQEMSPEGTARLARELDCQYIYQPASVHPHHGRLFGNAVMSRWPLSAHRMVVLPHPAPISGLRRIAVAADVDVAGRPLRAVSVHTATVVLRLEDRLAQVQTMVDSLIAPWDGPVVVGGDFNTATESAVVAVRRVLREAGLRSALVEQPTLRWHPARLIGQAKILDHIFVRGLAVGRAEVDATAKASDHFPVRATMSW